ncbi:Histone deacetylase hda1 [Coniosporium apollinis]|uniref:Histone deacetylase n=1 Tax=Coniosporium apollinis TaxID=61459 RepID=A0ABQ9NVM8_9PEZI|nr:Histone deacetylase hda1 [Coniosporium apollinis]
MDPDTDMLINESIVLSTEPNGHLETVNPASLFVGSEHESGERKDGSLGSHALTTAAISADVDEDMTEDSSSTESFSPQATPEAMNYVEPTRSTTVQVVIPHPKFRPLPYSSTQSGLVYDPRMRFHMEPISSMSDMDDIHPEDPRRIFEIYEELVQAGLVDDPRARSATPEYQLWRIPARHATPAEICLVHDREHVKWVASLESRTEEELKYLADKRDSVYLHHLTWYCATLSAGGAIEACRAVVAGHVKNSIAVIRPPGHHAEHDKPGGFCFFNNVCIAAKVCQLDFPETCRKILILDWDVHHGNGVQQAFYEDPNVLYISIHVHKNGTFYPMGDYGDHLHCGESAGMGLNINIPWSEHGMGDGDYMFAFQQVVMPIAMEFDPDLVIVSAGFDAAEGDKLGGCHVTPPCYAHMTHMLMSLARGKIAVCLEGGYNLRSIAKSALAVTRTLMGEPPDRLDAPEPSALGFATVMSVMRTQAQFWKCMYPKQTRRSTEDIQSVPMARMHDIIREWQSSVMWENYGMVPLLIHHTNLSKSFENQVLATRNYADANPLLVIFHDPPDVQGVPDPRTNKLELHNTYLTDVTKTYVDWAVKQGFGVIDVNIPKHYTQDDDNAEYTESQSQESRKALTREVATFLWENYIEPENATHIFLMGIGTAYLGVLDLISSHERTTESNKVDLVICFVADNPLNTVKRPADDNITNWYHEHSLVFVPSDHLAWDPARQRKIKKRYGNLVRSSRKRITDLLVEHREQVQEALLECTEKWRTEKAQEEERKKEALLKANAAVYVQNNLALRATEDRDSPVQSPKKQPVMGYFTATPPLRGPGSPNVRSPARF